MTAEVAVLNKRGIALAADSAVTTGFRGREKIFTTASKIFTLSKVHPVGIMINGHVEHFGCPWEIIIKDFRAHLGDGKCDDLKGYVDRFSKALKDKKFITEDGQRVSVIVAALSTISEVESRFSELRTKWNAKTLKTILEEMISHVNGKELVPGFEDVKQRTFDAAYGSLVEDVMTDERYSEYKTIPLACKSLFRAATFGAMTHQMGSQFATGIVIAGYGQEDLYPKLYELTVDGGFLGRVVCYDASSYDISTIKAGAAIATFAEDDTVKTFLSGQNDAFRIFNIGMFTHLMQLLAEEVLTTHTQLDAGQRLVALNMIRRRMSEAFDDFEDELEDFAEKEFRSPVLEVLRTAPKETLAELAESMVSIASLRQRVSGELETVGGPVDVALISKGEGFIWIKRKHYFDKELNPHYVRNYFREFE